MVGPWEHRLALSPDWHEPRGRLLKDWHKRTSDIQKYARSRGDRRGAAPAIAHGPRSRGDRRGAAPAIAHGPRCGGSTTAHGYSLPMTMPYCSTRIVADGAERREGGRGRHRACRRCSA